VTDPDVDVFGAVRQVFRSRACHPLHGRLPELRIRPRDRNNEEAVAYVGTGGPNWRRKSPRIIWSFNRDALFAGGIRPHSLLPGDAKRERHRPCPAPSRDLGNPAFFLGTRLGSRMRSPRRTTPEAVPASSPRPPRSKFMQRGVREKVALRPPGLAH